jgi:hypothetical protein
MQITLSWRTCLIVAGLMITAGVERLIVRSQAATGLPAVVALVGGFALLASAATFIVAAAVGQSDGRGLSRGSWCRFPIGRSGLVRRERGSRFFALL